MGEVGNYNSANIFLRQTNRTETVLRPKDEPAVTCTSATDWTQVQGRERNPPDWKPDKKSEKSQIRWSDKADSLQGPTTNRPVSSTFTSLCTHRDNDAGFGPDAQASCYNM